MAERPRMSDLPPLRRLPRFCPGCGASDLERQPFARHTTDETEAIDYDCYCPACGWSGDLSPDLPAAEPVETHPLMSTPHVDSFIWERFLRDKYARFVLMLFRLPAAPRHDWAEWIDPFKLFCTYQQKRYWCTGASRLGDVWLSANFNRDTGYELRVNVQECSEWGPLPAPESPAKEGPRHG